MPGSSTSSGIDQAVWLAVLGACAVVFVIALWRWRSDRSVTAGDILREQRARIRDQREICRATEALLARLEETARRAADVGDARALRLEALLRSADDRLNQLQDLVETVDRLRSRLAARRAARETPALFADSRNESAAGDAGCDATSPDPRGNSTPQDDSASSDNTADDRAGAAGTPARLTARSVSADTVLRADAPAWPGIEPPPPPADPARDAPSSEADRPAHDARFAEVYDLSAKGLTARQIAAALRMPLGEVELVLNLRAFV